MAWAEDGSGGELHGGRGEHKVKQMKSPLVLLLLVLVERWGLSDSIFSFYFLLRFGHCRWDFFGTIKGSKETIG